MAPTLALRYSSQAALRGTLAVGWSLDIPSIEVDRSLGYEEGQTFYRVKLGSVNGRLIDVPDKQPYPVARAFRVDFDTTFTRFFHSTPGASDYGPRGWVALTPDGQKHLFEEKPGATDFSTVWNITSQEDPYGNRVNYVWSAVTAPIDDHTIDYNLDRIEYTSNEEAGLDAHAKIEFVYAPIENCSFSNRPIGSAPRSNPEKVRWSRKLTAIRSYVRDTPRGEWRLVRETTLTYANRSSILHQPLIAPDPLPPDLFCTHYPLRYLTQIDITGYDVDGNSTTQPPLKFSYNNRVNVARPHVPFQPDPMGHVTIDTPGFPHQGTAGKLLDGAQSTLLDLDADGVRDLVSVKLEDLRCKLEWQRGRLGGTFEANVRTAPLPTALWYEQWVGRSDPQLLPTEGCTLNGQVAYRHRDVIGVDPALARGLVSYHFVDYTGDGRIDLLTNVWATVCHKTYDPRNQPQGNSACWPTEQPTITVFAAAIDLDDPPPGSSDFVPMEPEPGNDFRWRVYSNIGAPGAISFPAEENPVFSNVPMQVNSPRPIPPSMSDERVDDTVTPNFSIPTLTDVDGDGFLDVVDVTDIKDATCSGTVIGRCDWTVFFGNGGPTFPELIDAVDWHVPKFNMAVSSTGEEEETVNNTCGANFVRSKRTIATLTDIDSNGLPDLLVQTDDNRLKAFHNTGEGFADSPVDLGAPQVIERVQTDCTSQTSTDLLSGNRGYRSRFMDIDGDGLQDVIWFTGSNDDITGDNSVFARFNLGDRFSSRIQLTDHWIDAKRLLKAVDGEWHIDSDFVDVTGDGMADLTQWNENNTLDYIGHPGLGHAVDLLSRVDNGRGMRLSFRYAPSTDAAVVSRSGGQIGRFALPRVLWVVSTMTVDAGFDTPPMTTHYTYADPHYVTQSGYTGYAERGQFAGFGVSTQTILDAYDDVVQQVRNRYAYRTIDGNETLTEAPNGVLTETAKYRGADGDLFLHGVTTKSYTHKLLFSGKVRVTLPETTLTCVATSDGQTIDQCMAADDQIVRSEESGRGLRLPPLTIRPRSVFLDYAQATRRNYSYKVKRYLAPGRVPGLVIAI